MNFAIMIDLMVKSVFQYFQITSTCSQIDKEYAHEEISFQCCNQKPTGQYEFRNTGPEQEESYSIFGLNLVPSYLSVLFKLIYSG